MKPLFPGVFIQDGQLFTRSRFPGFRVHGERTLRNNGKVFRHWAFEHSKLAAALRKGLKTWPFVPGAKVLYLGAAQGVTPSFISDAIGQKGGIYGVEISKRALRDLIFVCEKRDNLAPILADASKPQEYATDVGEVDVVFEDVSARNQAEILLANADACLKKGGIAMIAIKSQSIDSAAKPEDTYKKTLEKITPHLELLESFALDPYEKDHLFAVFRKG